MMISPNAFANEHQGDSYEELLKLREELLIQIRDYEESDKSSSANIASFPTPEVKYMMNLRE